MQSSPESVLASFISHFQRLFDVKHVEGCFTKLTEVYRSWNEMNNFLKGARSILNLEATAPVNTILTSLRQLARDEIIFSPSDFKKDAHIEKSSFDASKLEINTRILRELVQLFDVPNIDSVVPLCKRLVNRVKTYDEVFPSLDDLVSQLYEILQCGNIESIVPCVQDLLRKSGQNNVLAVNRPDVSAEILPIPLSESQYQLSSFAAAIDEKERMLLNRIQENK